MLPAPSVDPAYKGIEVAYSECALNRRDSVAGKSRQWIHLSFDSVPAIGVSGGNHLRPDEAPGYPDYLLYRGPALAYEKDFIVQRGKGPILEKLRQFRR